MRHPSDCSVIELRDVVSSRASDGAALRGINLAFHSRTLHLVTGSAPAERALLLRLSSLLEVPESGEVLLGGIATRLLDDGARADLRGRQLGLVFASPFLLPSLTVIENIAMPLFKQAHLEPAEVRFRAEAALEFVGLTGFEEKLVADLNRFEQHCVSLARAIAAQPEALLVEELDSIASGAALLQFTALLREAAERFALTVIATSAPGVSPARAGRTVNIENGVVEHDSTLLRQPLA